MIRGFDVAMENIIKSCEIIIVRYCLNVTQNVSLTAKFKAKVSGDDKLKGDVNNDGVITVADAVCVLQKVLDSKFELPIQDVNSDYMWFADVDNNRILTAADASMILQKALNEDFAFVNEK